VEISNKYLRAALFTLLVLMCLYLVAQLRDFLADVWAVLRVLFIPFLAAMVVSYLLQPLVERLVARKVPRGAAILIIYFGFAVLLAALVVKMIPIASRQFTQLADHLPQMIAQADQWLDGIAARKRYLPDALRVGVEHALAQLQRNATQYAANFVDFLTGTVSAVFVAFVVPFLVFYMLKDAKAIGRGIVHLFPKPYRSEVREILAGIDETLGGYIRGQLLVMTAVGVLTYAGYLVIGLPYALLLAIFLFLMDIVPYIGPFLGAAPALILGFSISPMMALKVLIVNIIVQQCEGNLISPAIMGRTLHLHPMAIVAAILVGGQIGGMLGLICAVPVLAVAKVVYTHVRDYRSRHQT
jgi:predicted PurR-regulated permease PerM